MRRGVRLGVMVAAMSLLGGASGSELKWWGEVLSSQGVLAAAFSNRYEVDTIAIIDLVMRNASGQERRRRFHTVSKVIDDRVHSVGRLFWPPYLRGMTVLTIEARDRSHDAFVYLPSLAKVRRVTMTQRGDAFLGSDVTYEDFERRRVEEYELGVLESGEVAGEPVFLIRGRPIREMSYSRIRFAIARSDGTILETLYFKRGKETPYRVIVASRDSLETKDGHVLPTHLMVQNLARGTSTEVLIQNLQINPPIDDRVFSVVTLESRRSLPRSNGMPR